MTSAVPSALTRSSSAAICSPVARSSSPVGSSASSSPGRLASARAIATRCISPPESSDGRWSARAPRPDVVEQLRVRCRRSAFGTAASDCGSSTFSHAVSIGSRKKRWKTKPIWRSRSRLRWRSESVVTSCPWKSSVPPVGVSTQPSMCSSVDLPQPDGPANRQVIARRDPQRHVGHGRHRPRRHREDAAHVGGFDDMAVRRHHPITSSRSVAAIGSLATMRIG